MVELGRQAAASKALCAFRITLDSFLFIHDQRGSRQLRLAADQKNCVVPALVFCRFRQAPAHKYCIVAEKRHTVFWPQQFSGGKGKESYTGGRTAAGNLSKINNEKKSK